ncbi:tRNA (adenosine(37)-N6)-threonylcarbamoyltransferase complex ATPase subunit type 1 TsaE [Parvibaculaceae bacterium PLY_AMNH_Bact1]|nr:tRNA (adenosine(37)-N6)-threonylcarbamoyltransferase complex ATPase subunit type 1 TsaE [Parvibaculaceae bacterium PLY_AMNH_Bact1]
MSRITPPPTGRNDTTGDITLADVEATNTLGEALSDLVGPRDVIALWGDLGAGKTSLARAIIQTLLAASGLREDVPSPTFTLVQIYEAGTLPIWHADLYRLSDPDELIELGLEEALEGGLLLIEWPDRMGEELPVARLDIELKEVGDGRLACLTGRGATWEDRLNRALAKMNSE